VQLHPVRTCAAPDDFESLVEAELVALGEHALGLFDRDARLECLLELGAPLVCRLGDGQKATHCSGSLVGTTSSKRVDRLLRGVLAHAD